MERPIRSSQYHHIIIPTNALSAINSLPKPSPLDWIAKWWADAVIHLVWSQKTTMIDRALAEDLAQVFGVSVEDIPDSIGEIREFVSNYVMSRVDETSLVDTIVFLGGVTHSLNVLIESMVDQLND